MTHNIQQNGMKYLRAEIARRSLSHRVLVRASQAFPQLAGNPLVALLAHRFLVVLVELRLQVQVDIAHVA